jgi:hypothetical protein
MLNIVSLNRDGRATINLKAPIVIMVISLALFSPPPTSVPPIRGQLREPTLRQGRGTNRDNRGNRSGVWTCLLGFHLLVRGHNDRAEQESSP